MTIEPDHPGEGYGRIKQWLGAIEELSARNAALRASHDRLLAAAKGAVDMLLDDVEGGMTISKMLKAAIAEAEKGK